MSFIAVRWLHSDPNYPVELYSELDTERNEVRKVEIFADGRMHFANSVTHTGDTMLGLVSVPSLNEIAADSQFEPRVISAKEFEDMWTVALRKNT